MRSNNLRGLTDAPWEGQAENERGLMSLFKKTDFKYSKDWYI